MILNMTYFKNYKNLATIKENTDLIPITPNLLIYFMEFNYTILII